ncbi:MAG TPA: glycosyltransferase family 4 protein [Candidatus Kerfeldbacteria bacterium]|nr:glycosyltransferase family 4 protein [Candidatus Kerfeldbacteria bacterium]
MSRNFKVALAHDHLFQLGGAENVLQELMRCYPSAPLYTLIHHPKNFYLDPSVDVHTSFLQKLPGGLQHFKWYLALMPMAWEQFDFSSYDIVISSASAFVKGIVTHPSTIHISYCHSPTRYLWSDTLEYVNNLSLPAVARVPLLQLLSRLRQWDQTAAQRVDYFIANSRYVSERIKKYYRRDSTVIYPPVPIDSFSLSDTIHDYYLIVSRLRPYKRVDLAIEAFNQLKLPLVIIGGGEEMQKLRRKARHNITFLGEVDEQTKRKYLSRCKAFIHPQEEDFGISAVEAMASGRPVIAYGAGGATETIVEGLTGTLFNEQSWEALVYAILKCDVPSFDSMAIRSHAMKFDTIVFQKQIMQFVKNAVERV